MLPPQRADTSAEVLPGPFHVRTKVTVGQGTRSCRALPGSAGCWEFLEVPRALGSGLFLGTPVHPGTSHFWVLLSIIVCSAFPDLPLFWHVFATTFVFKK